MKKTLFAMAALAALPTAATSADVTMYGLLDLGLAFYNVDPGVQGADSYSNLSMQSGQTAGSRIGMRGYEDLGNGHRVGFILETGTNLDSGSLGQGGRLFGRQSLLYVEGPYGNVKFGKMGALASGYPSTGLFGGNMAPFAVGMGEVAGLRYINSGEYLVPMDNTITYASPSWAGWQFMLQYSMGMNGDDGVENESSVNRHMAAAIRFDNKTTEFNLVVDSTNWRSFGDKKYGDSPDDSFAVTVGVRHDLGFMKIYGGGHYFQDARSFAQEAYQFYSGTGQHEDVNGADVDPFLSYSFGKDGFSLNIGADYPAMGGTWKVHFGYMDAERSDDSSQKMKRWYAAGGYWYNLSKRSTIYSGISFIQDNLEGGNYDKLDDANAITAGLGLVHTF